MGVRHYDVIVIGASSGGYEALRTILSELPATFPVPVVVVSHVTPDSGQLLPDLLGYHCALAVREAEDKAELAPACVQVAPPGYHLLIEEDETFSLSVDAKVCGSRPSIDVLFESAADAFGGRVIGIVLTGANDDGARGLRAIADGGGVGIVQDPEEAHAPEMPAAAIAAGGARFVLPLAEIPGLLLELTAESPGVRREV